ncbi:MAG: hypothetical protein ABR519_00695 [Bacteroidales bacterium]
MTEKNWVVTGLSLIRDDGKGSCRYSADRLPGMAEMAGEFCSD